MDRRNKDRTSLEVWRLWVIGLIVVMAAVLAYGVKILHEDVEHARAASERNTRILALVEGCVVEGECGPRGGGDSDTENLIKRILAGLDCLAGEETPLSYEQCVEQKMGQVPSQPSPGSPGP